MRCCRLVGGFTDLAWIGVREETNSRSHIATQTHILDSIKARGAAPLKELIAKVGGWPVVEGENWDEQFWSWEKVIKETVKSGLVTNFPVSLSSFTLKNSTRTVLSVRQFNMMKMEMKLNLNLQIWAPELSLTEGAYIEQQQDNGTFQSYQRHQIDLAVQFGADKLKAESEMADALDFEVKLANV